MRSLHGFLSIVCLLVIGACGGAGSGARAAPCLPRPPADLGAVASVAPASKDWVAWTTPQGWLHVGTRAELERAQPVREEIWGGTSDAPLEKRALPYGPWATQAEALDDVCARLTRVHLSTQPSAFPAETVQGTIDGAEYHLQLGRGGAPDDVLWVSQNYDHGDQLRILGEHGISPRVVFAAPQWLAHATGMGTMDGPRQLDQWFLVGFAPQGGHFELPDGTGGTFGYSYDQALGPFADNFALAPALRRLGISSLGGVSVDLVQDPPIDHGRQRCAE